MRFWKYSSISLIGDGLLCKAWVRNPGHFFRGKDMSYVETSEEQKVRELWERHPFSTADSVVGTVLTTGFATTPLLRRLDKPSSEINSGYEDLFRPLYADPCATEIQTSSSSSPDKRRHFLIQLAYRGGDFCGWQRQPNNNEKPSVQQLLEDWLAIINNEGQKVDVRVCGRTDAGVHAIGQVCRFRTRKALEATDVQNHLQLLPSPSIKSINVTRVTKAFHPSFAATCRAYAYLIDTDSLLEEDWNQEKIDSLNGMLHRLEGQELDYFGVSYGPLKTQTTLCTLYHARACLVVQEDNNQAAAATLCIELVGDRFLRRMVRLLVGTAMCLVLHQEAPAVDALLDHIQKKDRQLVGKAAPPDGLIFVGAQFDAL